MLPRFKMQDQYVDDLLHNLPEELPVLPLRITVAFPFYRDAIGRGDTAFGQAD
jgi:hypothetical protein